MTIDITQKLKEKGMSRYELANRIDVTYPTITSIYNGKSTSIKLDILEKLCKELNCTPNDILIFNDEKSASKRVFNDLSDNFMNKPEGDTTQ